MSFVYHYFGSNIIKCDKFFQFEAKNDEKYSLKLSTRNVISINREIKTTKIYRLKIKNKLSGEKFKFELPSIISSVEPKKYFHYLDDIFVISYEYAFLMIDLKGEKTTFQANNKILFFEPETRFIVVKNIEENTYYYTFNLEKITKDQPTWRIINYPNGNNEFLLIPFLAHSKRYFLEKGFNIPAFDEMTFDLYGPFPDIKRRVYFSDGKISFKYSYLVQLDSDFINSQLENGDEIYIPTFSKNDFKNANLNLMDFLGIKNFRFWIWILKTNFERN